MVYGCGPQSETMWLGAPMSTDAPFAQVLALVMWYSTLSMNVPHSSLLLGHKPRACRPSRKGVACKGWFLCCFSVRGSEGVRPAAQPRVGRDHGVSQG